MMESIPMCFNVHQVKVMKIALAIAILKQKPEGISTRQYIERITLLVSGDHCNWKRKAENLSKELLQLKQKMAVEQIGGSISENCDTASGSSYKGHFSQQNEYKFNKELESHIRFIQCISQTKQALQNLPPITPEVSQTICDTVLCAVDGLRKAVKEYGCGVDNTLISVIHTIVGIVMEDSMRFHRDALMKSCSELSRTCIEQLQTMKTVDSSVLTLQHIVLTISFSQEIYIDSLKALTDYVVETVKKLMEGDCLSLLSMNVINSLGTCIRLTELLLLQVKDTNAIQIPVNLIENVESILFEVDDMPLPLVSYSLWRLHAIMIC